MIEQYLDREEKERAGQRQRHHRIKDRFKKVMRDMSYEDRRAVHAFITATCGHSFHAGIRLGVSGNLAMRETDGLVDSVDE